MTAPDHHLTPASGPPVPGRTFLPELHAVADELVAAVHALDRQRIAAALRRARDAGAPHSDPAEQLSVLLAAAVGDDAGVPEHTAWTRDVARYRRLRRTGMAPATACALIADDLHRQEPPRA